MCVFGYLNSSSAEDERGQPWRTEASAVGSVMSLCSHAHCMHLSTILVLLHNPGIPGIQPTDSGQSITSRLHVNPYHNPSLNS